MEGRDSNSPPLRAVLLSRDPLVGARVERLCSRGWRAVRVAGGYEAAAEILASPVAALLIDLRAMSGIHGRLLELAGRMEVQTFAVAGDAQSTDGQAMAPLRRVELEDIPAILASLAAEEAPAAQAEPPAEIPPASPDAGRYEPEGAPAPQPSAEGPSTSPGAGRDESAGSLAAEMRAVLTPEPKRPKTRSAKGGLTPEQLAALLEDEQ